MKKEQEHVKLHATLMNSSFIDDFPAKFKERFDATEIFKVTESLDLHVHTSFETLTTGADLVHFIFQRHKETYLGKTTLNQIDISELGTATKNDYYKSVGSITL